MMRVLNLEEAGRAPCCFMSFTAAGQILTAPL
jgi:hypothetical protein